MILISTIQCKKNPHFSSIWYALGYNAQNAFKQATVYGNNY